MSLPVPNLDDRDFADLVREARARIQQLDPDWTDLSVHDPGIVLVEGFAHLTDVLLYRLNQLPDRLYAVYLNLLGTALYPPASAHVTLEFSRAAVGDSDVLIPRGTLVGGAPGVPGEPQPLFSTVTDAVLAAGSQSLGVAAVDASFHDAVLVGEGTGRPGQTFTLPVVPAVAGPELAIGVTVQPGERVPSGGAVSVGGKAFRLCREVDIFSNTAPGEMPVRVDRAGGTVVFAWWDQGDPTPPAAPAAGAEVRAWFRTGGGERGNVPAGWLTIVRTPVAGVRVRNPAPATGGRDIEAVKDALCRAPQHFHARDRAVTARDYEVLAAAHGGVARARAVTRRSVWKFASPGEVEVVLVPHVPVGDRPGGRVSPSAISAFSTEDVRVEVDQYLRDRATIGAEPVVRWVHCKEVLVDARVVVRPDENVDAIRDRIQERFATAINPLNGETAGFGSGFGRALRVSNLYRAMEESEPGVQYVDRVRIEVLKTPDEDAIGLVAAGGQPHTWFVGQRDTLFRSTNSGDGWEACAAFPGEQLRAVSPYPGVAAGRDPGVQHPGMMAVITAIEGGSRVHVSSDLGETWRQVAQLGFALADACWIDRGGHPVLLLAGESGVYELALGDGAVPVQNIVDPTMPDRGFSAIESLVDVRGRVGVVAAGEASAGIWLSADAGAPASFRAIRGPGDDVRCMMVQYDGPGTVIWFGSGAPEGTGTGCARLRLDELARTHLDQLQSSWEPMGAGWSGGTCWSLQVIGDALFAATQSSGVVRLALGPEARWDQRDVNCGLPLRDRTRFEPVRAVSGEMRSDGRPLVIASGPRGVYRSGDEAVTWSTCSARVVNDVVTLPETWLFCSGEHRIKVVHAHG